MKKKPAIIGIIALMVIGGLYFVFTNKDSASTNTALKPTKAPAPVNTLPVNERPYVELKPLASRNDLDLTIGPLIKAASSVEVALEYDRNKGVLDAVLKQFNLTETPFLAKLFMGTRSAGGHITYHDDVIGGKLTLTFDGEGNRYALEVPWRYDDTATSYKEISTADAKFQLTLEKPWSTPKILVMQSPGLPAPLTGSLLAGPYLVRGIGEMPSGNASLKIRLNEDSTQAVLFGFDGKTWQKIESTLDGKTLSATSPMYSYFAATNQ